jgi:hypothetical protein
MSEPVIHGTAPQDTKGPQGKIHFPDDPSFTRGKILHALMNEIGKMNIKILAKGTEITTAFLDKLIARGITRVTTSDCDMACLNESRSASKTQCFKDAVLQRRSASKT